MIFEICKIQFRSSNTLSFSARREFVIFLYVTFLGIVPFIAVVSLFMYYMKRNPTFWRKKPRIATYVPCLKHQHSTAPKPVKTIDPIVTPEQSEPIYSIIEDPAIESCNRNPNLGVENKMFFTEHPEYNIQASKYSPEKPEHIDNNETVAPFKAGMQSYKGMENPSVLNGVLNEFYYDSDDSFDSNWDVDSCRSSICKTPSSLNKNSHLNTKCVLRKSKSFLSSAKQYACQHITSLSAESNTKVGEKNVTKEKPKIDIVKSELVFTTNEQVQTMMISSLYSSSLKNSGTLKSKVLP